MKGYSEIFGWSYEHEDTICITNTKQAGLYIEHCVPLVDLFWSKDRLVFVFDKIASKEAYKKWCDYELR